MGMLHLLLQWCHLWQHGPPGGTLDLPVGENYSQECPASISQLPCWRGCCEGYWGGNSPIVRPMEGSCTFQTLDEEPTRREQSPNRFPGWKEVLHPSRLVIAAWQILSTSWGCKQRPHSRSSGKRMAQHQKADEELKVLGTKSEPTLSTKVLVIAWQVSPPPGFLRVTACLQRDPLLE